MEACWKPGKSHRKLTRKTAESRTLGVSMASDWQRLPERRQRWARGAQSGWTAAGARLLPPTPSARSGVPATQTSALPRPLPPLAGRGGEENRGWEERPGGAGRRCGGEGPRCAGVAVRSSAPVGRARGCRAVRSSRVGFSELGKAGAAARGEQARGILRARVSLALSEGPSLCSAVQGLGPRQLPPLCWKRAAPEKGRGGGAPRDSSERAPLQPTAC